MGKIADILPEVCSTWENRTFLTIDIDWAHDHVLADTIDLIDKAGVHATWFVTHDTPLLEKLRANQNYELGIHPNFNWLLSGDFRHGRNPREVVDRLLAIVPNARSIRSHSMTQSTELLKIFSEAGLTHDANHFIPSTAGIPLKPWRLWNGMVRIPYCWEDDITCIYREQSKTHLGVSETIQMGNLCVFDFHPIHIFLNTECMMRYEKARPLYHLPDKLIAHQNHGEGSRSWLRQLLELMSQSASLSHSTQKKL